MASALAKASEDDKAALEQFLGVDLSWTTPASIAIAEEDILLEGEAETLYAVVAVRDGRAEHLGGLYPNRLDPAVRRAVVALALYGLADNGARAQGRSRCSRDIPLWLIMGLEQTMSAEGRAAVRAAMGEIVKDDPPPRLADLFAHKGHLRTNEARERFAIASGSLVDFLLADERGPARLVEAVTNLWSKSDLALSVRWVYRDRFGSLEAMEEAWLKFAAERPEHALGGEGLSLVETRRRLAEILVVEIPVVERGTVRERIERTDLRGLFAAENAALRWEIGREKMAALSALLVRSKEEYRPVIEKYIEAVRAAVGRDRGLFRLKFREAERLKERVERLPYFVEEEAASDAGAGHQ